MHQVVTAQLAARRAGTQSTKTRAEVRGGGAKPWKQKGTGRARQGSIRSPQWKGGGVALGPKPRSYAQRTPKKMIQLALRSALSDRAADGKVVVVDDWGFDAPEHQGGRRRPRRPRPRGSRRRRARRPTTSSPPRASATCRASTCSSRASSTPTTSSCSDYVVFTRDTLPGETTEAPAPAKKRRPGHEGHGQEGRRRSKAAAAETADDADLPSSPEEHQPRPPSRSIPPSGSSRPATRPTPASRRPRPRPTRPPSCGPRPRAPRPPTTSADEAADDAGFSFNTTVETDEADQ